ncbi:PREDICTED: rab-like protein 2B [Condylura cristata]|uniref:rab-like protein 2B n=1 Tax=Condylura cristata TaxID=143302 RepID=UPI0006438BA9|nr:PREDICTED: rab-like protein 2B [Condylura cristata]
MAGADAGPSELDQGKYDADDSVKIICLGDSAVGKSKLMERFLLDGFQPQQLSTYALTLYKYTATVDGRTVLVDFWDTAGQERFHSVHASYYHKAHACIMVGPRGGRRGGPRPTAPLCARGGRPALPRTGETPQCHGPAQLRG